MNSTIKDLGFTLLTDAENHYKENQNFSINILQALHSLFGQLLIEATELLETGKFRQLESHNKLRKIYKVGSRYDQYTLFPDVNYCRCAFFENEVLSGKCLTCKHILAAKIAGITQKFKIETVSDGVLADLLNYELDKLE